MGFICQCISILGMAYQSFQIFKLSRTFSHPDYASMVHNKLQQHLASIITLLLYLWTSQWIDLIFGWIPIFDPLLLICVIYISFMNSMVQLTIFTQWVAIPFYSLIQYIHYRFVPIICFICDICIYTLINCISFLKSLQCHILPYLSPQRRIQLDQTIAEYASDIHQCNINDGIDPLNIQTQLYGPLLPEFETIPLFELYTNIINWSKNYINTQYINQTIQNMRYNTNNMLYNIWNQYISSAHKTDPCQDNNTNINNDNEIILNATNTSITNISLSSSSSPLSSSTVTIRLPHLDGTLSDIPSSSSSSYIHTDIPEPIDIVDLTYDSPDCDTTTNTTTATTNDNNNNNNNASFHYNNNNYNSTLPPKLIASPVMQSSLPSSSSILSSPLAPSRPTVQQQQQQQQQQMTPLLGRRRPSFSSPPHTAYNTLSTAASIIPTTIDYTALTSPYISHNLCDSTVLSAFNNNNTSSSTTTLQSSSLTSPPSSSLRQQQKQQQQQNSAIHHNSTNTNTNANDNDDDSSDDDGDLTIVFNSHTSPPRKQQQQQPPLHHHHSTTPSSILLNTSKTSLSGRGGLYNTSLEHPLTAQIHKSTSMMMMQPSSSPLKPSSSSSLLLANDDSNTTHVNTIGRNKRNNIETADNFIGLDTSSSSSSLQPQPPQPPIQQQQQQQRIPRQVSTRRNDTSYQELPQSVGPTTRMTRQRAAALAATSNNTQQQQPQGTSSDTNPHDITIVRAVRPSKRRMA